MPRSAPCSRRSASRLVGKILLDVSNPLDVTPAGISFRTPVQGSAGQFVATLLPDGVGHAKAFSNHATAALAAAADQTPRAVLPYLADSADTAQRVGALLDETGWVSRYVGDIDRSAELEIGGRYNKVAGRLGRTVLDENEFTRQFGPAMAAGGLTDDPASSAAPTTPPPRTRRRTRNAATASRSGATWWSPTTC